MRRTQVVSLVAGAAFACVTQQQAQAASATWTGADSGIWTVNNNWGGTAYPGTSGTSDVATFDSAGNGNTTITASALSIGGINFTGSATASYTIGSGTLSFANAGSISVASTVLNTQVIASSLVAGSSGISQTAYQNGFVLSNTSPVARLDVSGNITGPAGTLNALVNVRGTGAVNISGNISDGTTKLAVNSNRVGTTTLSGTNTFSGVANNSGIAGLDYNLSVAMGGRLVLDYSSGNVVVPASTTIALGSAGNAGGFTSGGNSGGTLVFKTGSAPITVGSIAIGNTYNNIVVDAAGGSGAVVTVGNAWNNWGGSSRATANIDLSAAGSGGGLKLAGAPAGALTTSAGVFRIHTRAITLKDASGETYFANLDGSNNVIAQTTYTALPTITGATGTNYKLETSTTATGNTSANVVRIEPTSAGQTYNLGGFTLTLNSAGLILDGANSFSITNGNITTSSTPTGLNLGAFGSGKLTVGATISGNKDINRSGDGLVELTGNNSANTGALRPESGVTRVASANALTAGSLSISNGGIVELGFDLTRALGTGAGQIQFSGGGPGGFSAYGADRAVNIGGAGVTLSYSVPTATATNFVASRDSQLVLSAATSDATIDFQNGLNFAGDTQTILVNNGSAVIDAKLSGALTNGGLVKTGTGTLSLTSNGNTYAGGTVVVAGTLSVNNASGSGTGSGEVIVLDGGTLAGDGSLSGPIAIRSGGVVAPGNSVGTVDTGAVSLSTGAIYRAEVDLTSLTADQINVTGLVSLDGTLEVSLLNGPLTGSHTFVLINNDSTDAIAGDFALVVYPGDSSYTYTTSKTGETGNDYTITITAVPEPGSLALVGLGASLLAARRRRIG